MTKINSIRKNSVHLILANVGNAFLIFLITILIARELGPTGLGIYSFAMVIAAIIASIMELGLDGLVTREVARNKKKTDKLLATSLGIRLIGSVILLITILLILDLFGLDPTITESIILLAIYVSIRNLTNSLKSIFRAYEKMSFEAIIVLTHGGIIFLILGSLFLLFGFGLREVFIVFIISSLIEFAIGNYFIRKNFVKPRIEFDFSILKKVLKNTFPFWVMGVLLSILIATDIVMINFLQGIREVGFYNAAYRIMVAPMMIVLPFAMVLYPRISKYFTSSKKKFTELFHRALRLLVIFSLPISIFFVFYSEEITLLIYGNEFAPTVQVFQILSFFPVLISVNILLGTALNAINKQKEHMFITALVFIINALANFLLINKFGFIGAGYATLAILVIYFVLATFTLKNALKELRFRKTTLTIILANIGFAVIIGLVREPFILIAVLSPLIYLVLLKIFRINLLQELKLG